MSLTSSIWKYVVVTALLWSGPWCPASLAQSAPAGLEPTEIDPMTREKKLQTFRRIRDQVERQVKSWVEEVSRKGV